MQSTLIQLDFQRGVFLKCPKCEAWYCVKNDFKCPNCDWDDITIEPCNGYDAIDCCPNCDWCIDEEGGRLIRCSNFHSHQYLHWTETWYCPECYAIFETSNASGGYSQRI